MQRTNKVKFILHILVIFLLWNLFVLYPKPYRLGISIYRIFNPEINPSAVSHLLEDAPEDPREIEKYVLTTIPYQYDWQTYGVPFYFPKAEEVIAKGTGDCKSRFVVLASIFEAKGIPYRQSFSLSHFWVDYEGKAENKIEQNSNALLVRNENGTKLQIPQEDLKEVYEALKEGFWDYMPVHRKVLFMAGLPMSILMVIFINQFKVKKRQRYSFRF